MSEQNEDEKPKTVTREELAASNHPKAPEHPLDPVAEPDPVAEQFDAAEPAPEGAIEKEAVPAEEIPEEDTAAKPKSKK